MTSEQIRQQENNITNPVAGFTAVANWLQEIAEQLAVMNEREAAPTRSLMVELCATNDVIPVRVMPE